MERICLDPPLKRIPLGKWQCPKCRSKSDSVELISHLDSSLNQARTKICGSRSKTLSSTEKVSQMLGGSHFPSKRSLSGENSIVTPEVQPLEGKPDLSPGEEPCTIKPGAHPWMAPFTLVASTSTSTRLSMGSKFVKLKEMPSDDDEALGRMIREKKMNTTDKSFPMLQELISYSLSGTLCL